MLDATVLVHSIFKEVPVRVASTRLRVVLAGLLVVSAMLLGVGSTLERHQDTNHAAETATTGRHPEAAESGSESAGGSESGPSRSVDHGETETRLLGIGTESLGLEVTAVALSVGLAVAVCLTRHRAVLMAVIVLGLAFTAGDTRELAHQLSEGRPGLATIAAGLIALHLAIAGVAAVLTVHRSPESATTRQATS